MNDDRLLNVREVQQMTSLSRPTIYRFIGSGRFPKPIKLSPKGRVAWRASHIQIWIENPLGWDESYFAPDVAF